MNRKRLYWFLLLLAMITSFVIKFTTLNKYAAPPGADYGNYLMQVNILNGNDVTGFGLRYNPLFFVLLDPFLLFFDALTALKVVASLVFSTAAIPFFLLAKKLSNSNLAALITSWTFLFFEGFSEMIGWGGNPNFLGFSFMLLTLFFFVSSFEDPSKKNILLTGFSLSLVIGTHFLVTAIAVLFLFVFAILTLALNRKNFKRSIIISLSIIGVSALFSLPYIPVYTAFFKDSSSSLVSFNLFNGVNAAIAGLEWMFRDQYLIILAMTALGVLALYTHAKKNRNDSIILLSLFMVPFILGLLTENPDRWFYFLPIPVMLSFALCLGGLFKAIKDKGTLKVPLVLCFILVIVVGTTITGISRLDTAVDYYQTIGNDELQALNWIKNETYPNATFATSGSNTNIGGGGNSYSWWIEGYSERECIPAGPPALYTYADERSQVEAANNIFAGTYTFEYGNMRVSEDYPSGMCNPEIAGYIDGQYQNLLFLSDGEELITFSPLGNNQTVWSEAPLYAVNKTVNMYYSGTLGNATFVYEWPNLKVTRSVIMDGGQSVDVVFELEPANSTLQEFTVNVWGAFYSSLESFDVQNSSITLQQKLQTNDQVETRIAVLSTNGEIEHAQVFAKDPEYSMTLATYSLKPLQDDLSVHLRISIITKMSGASNNNTINLYNAYDLLKDMEIDYIFLNKGWTDEYNRFLSDSEHYRMVFENGSIVIFRVNLEGNS